MWDLIVSVPDHCLSFYFTSKQQSKASNISEHHENNKTTLIFGSIIIGVAALTLYKIT